MERKKSLRGTLQRVGVPLLETAFFSQAESARLRDSHRERMPSRLLASLEQLHHTGVGAAAAAARARGTGAADNADIARVPSLNWPRVSGGERNGLLEYLAVNSPQGGYTSRELRSLKRLPVYETMSGGFTAL